MQKRTTGFVTLPIVALAAASLGVVLVSLAIGARETDGIALNRQRETIEHAIDQHGLSLARELRVQSVWNEGYERSHANDTAWLRKFYGAYLSELLGYDRLYVISSDNKPVFGFAPDNDADTSRGFALIGPAIQDLIRAVRDPAAMPTDYNVVTTDIALGNGTVVHHHAVADVRDIGGRPATVVVSTIVPDHTPPQLFDASPYLLIAVEDLDKQFTKHLGANFGFRDLEWVTGAPPVGDVTELVKALDGATVGTLAWRKDRPGLEFIRRVAPGLGIALVLLIALTYALIRWGNRQAQRILQSEEHARLAARTDPLTGLPNRVGLRESFARLLSEAAAKASTLGVLSFDIDQFKGINDTFGHTVGDAVLRAIAKRLRGLLEPDALLARPDGDNFVMLVPGLDADGTIELATDMLTALAEPIDLDVGTRVFRHRLGRFRDRAARWRYGRRAFAPRRIGRRQSQGLGRRNCRRLRAGNGRGDHLPPQP